MIDRCSTEDSEDGGFSFVTPRAQRLMEVMYLTIVMLKDKKMLNIGTLLCDVTVQS